MARVPLLMLAPIGIFAGFVALAGVGMFRDTPDKLPSTRVGGAAPAITKAALPGYPPVTEADLLRGEVSLVNFWASWCPPCRAEHPRLMEFAREGVPIIGVNYRDRARHAARYLEDDGNPFVAVAFDENGRSALDWGVTAPPETFIVNGEGTVLFRFQGPLVGSDFEQRFLPALTQARSN